MRRTEKIEIRVSKLEKAHIKQRAKRSQLKLSEFVREIALTGRAP